MESVISYSSQTVPVPNGSALRTYPKEAAGVVDQQEVEARHTPQLHYDWLLKFDKPENMVINTNGTSMFIIWPNKSGHNIAESFFFVK